MSSLALGRPFEQVCHVGGEVAHNTPHVAGLTARAGHVRDALGELARDGSEVVAAIEREVLENAVDQQRNRPQLAAAERVKARPDVVFCPWARLDVVGENRSRFDACCTAPATSVSAIPGRAAFTAALRPASV